MKIKKKQFIRFIIGLFLFLLIILSLDFYIEELSSEENDLKRIPNVNLSTTFGDAKLISDVKSEVILIDFWFSKCIPCIQEMKFFPELLARYKDELTIISYSIDKPKHTEEILLSNNDNWEFLDETNPNWIFSNDNHQGENSLIEPLKVKYYPTYYLINNKGEIIDKPKSGIYGIEKTLNGALSIGTTFKKYTTYFDISKLWISLFLYLILFALYLLIRFCILKLKTKN